MESFAFLKKFLLGSHGLGLFTAVRFGPQRRQSAKELMLSKCGAGHEFEQTLGDSGGQNSLACCSP